jgi:hypothetical protein
VGKKSNKEGDENSQDEEKDVKLIEDELERE